MRKLWLYGGTALVAAILLIPVGQRVVYSQAAAPTYNNCAGAFTPTLNCIIQGQFNFTNTSQLFGTTYNTPFGIAGVPVQATAADFNTIHTASLTLNNTQMAAVGTTPVTIISAPPRGYVVRPIGGLTIFNYTAAYSSTDLKLFYTSRTQGPAASSLITGSVCFNVSADTTCSFSGVPDDEVISSSTTTPVAVVLQGVTGASMGAGNAANTVTVKVQYLLYPLTGL